MAVAERVAEVAAVVVTHNSAGFMPACLESLAAQAGDLDLRVVVADSGSTDEVESICAERRTRFLAGPNRGFGAAVNRALRHASVREARYVLAMNPDVVLEGSLAEFIRLADRRPKCAIFAPRQIDQHGRPVFSMGREPSPASYWWDWQTGWPKWIWDPEAYESEARCDWVMGAFMLVRRPLLESLGGFDERFFLYSEEVDLCTRARLAGWGVAYLPQLTVRHWEADRSVDEHRERLRQWGELVYMRKWYGRRDRISMRVAMLARLTRQLLRRLRAREPAREEWIRLWAALHLRRRRYGPA
jgi:GT2 family glycosyltransferase